MSLGKILGSISPLAGAISGKGLFGKALPALAGGGLFGLAGILASLLGQDGGEEEPQQSGAPQAQPPQQPMQQPMQPFSQYGMEGGQFYAGGRKPMGQNPLGRLLGNIF